MYCFQFNFKSNFIIKSKKHSRIADLCTAVLKEILKEFKKPRKRKFTKASGCQSLKLSQSYKNIGKCETLQIINFLEKVKLLFLVVRFALFCYIINRLKIDLIWGSLMEPLKN